GSCRSARHLSDGSYDALYSRPLPDEPRPVDRPGNLRCFPGCRGPVASLSRADLNPSLRSVKAMLKLWKSQVSLKSAMGTKEITSSQRRIGLSFLITISKRSHLAACSRW